MFKDRKDGGARLAGYLAHKYAGKSMVVFGLPRGGVVTAREVADRLRVPLDVVVTRKIGHPGNPEYAIGALAEGGLLALNEEAARTVPSDWLEQERKRQLEEIDSRLKRYEGLIRHIDLTGKTAILVDDGIATGYTMKAAILSVIKRNPERIVVATPVAPPRTIDRLKSLADDVVVCIAPEQFFSIGQFYEDFDEVTDRQAMQILKEPAAAS